jgi:hypothetical protein
MAQPVARNRQDLERALSTITAQLLKEKGYICFVDVFMKLGSLSKSDYENWRFQRVSPLERVLNVKLSRINFIMKTVRRNSLNGHLTPSMTVYEPWGKARRRFCNFPHPATRRLRRCMPPISFGRNTSTRHPIETLWTSRRA